MVEVVEDDKGVLPGGKGLGQVSAGLVRVA
jgi:hypothetical protein